jgi:quercetin dioxygenase-like cupin family protein
MKLVELGGRAPLRSWASSLGKGAKALQRSREKLQAAGLVTYDAGEYHVAHAWQAKVLAVLEGEGSLEARERDSELYKQQREDFAELRRMRGYSK